MDGEQKIYYYRLVLFVLAIVTQIRQQIINCVDITNLTGLAWFDECIGRNKQVTIQTNYFVIIWLALALLWRKDDTKLNRLYGSVKTAATVYITITFLVYWTVLSGEVGDVLNIGEITWTNIVQHYVVPLGFIADWVLTERTELTMKMVPYWLIYPLIVQIFSLFNGGLDLSYGYLYFFLNVGELGIGGYVVWMIILYALFFLMSTLYVFINKRIISNS